MGITNRIPAANIILDLDASTKHALLQALAAQAAQRLELPTDEILDALENREALGSTALGRGVALPHARLTRDSPPLMLFVRLGRPVDYDARDEEPVDLVVLVLWPEAAAEGFLPALSDTCRALREPQALRRLRAATSAEEIVALLDRYGTPSPETEEEE
ncbi:MAG TPA: PTS sugar transporter subunit IIA [Roseomonas sp.]|nr:PTS sugar transporter subunit IIA [Roseomonas sp.]